MRRMVLALVAPVVLVLAGQAQAPDRASPALLAAHGEVAKATRDSLSIRPRNDEGRFGKTLILKITGTSNITTVSLQKRAGKLVLVQTKAEPTDLSARQHVAVVYWTTKAGPVLLSAVASPAGR